MYCNIMSTEKPGSSRSSDDGVTNEEVYNTYLMLVKQAKVDKKKVSVKDLCDYFSQKFDSFAESTANPTTIYSKVTNIHKIVTNLTRNKNVEGKERLFAAPFKVRQKVTNDQRALSSTKTKKEMELASELHEVKNENKALKRSLNEIENEEQQLSAELGKIQIIYDQALNSMHNNILQLDDYARQKDSESCLLKDNIELLKLDFDKQSKELDNIINLYAECKNKLKSAKTKNLMRTLERRDKKILIQTEKIKVLQNEKLEALREADESKSLLQLASYDLVQVKRELENAENCLETARLDKKKLQFKISYLKRKAGKNTKNNGDNELLKQVVDYEEQITQLENENKELEQLVDLLQDDEIVTFQEGKYCDEVREVIMELLSMDVSMNQVNNVIKIVLKKLANKNVGRLPSMGLKSRLLLEARWLSKSQAGMAMETEDISPYEGNCLHGDGTSKYHKKYQNFQITTKSGRSYTFGLTEMAGGDLLLL